MNQVFVLITTKYNKLKEVMDALLSVKEIVNMHTLYGQYDIIINIKAKDMNEIDKILMHQVAKIDGIERTETLVVSDIPIA